MTKVQTIFIVLKMNSIKENAEKMYKAFSDDERMRLFLRILQNGPKGIHVNDLTSLSRLSRPAVSHHLKILKNCELIDSHKEGTKVYYFVSCDEKFNELKKNLGILEKGFNAVNFSEIQKNSRELVDMIDNAKNK